MCVWPLPPSGIITFGIFHLVTLSWRIPSFPSLSLPGSFSLEMDEFSELYSKAPGSRNPDSPLAS